MPVALSYQGSRGRSLRSRRRAIGSRASKSASTQWRAGWVDPVIILTPGLTGNTQVLGPTDLDEFEQVSVVGGFIQIAGFVINSTSEVNFSGGYLIMGLRTQVNTIVDIAEMPDPFNESSGDWLWYRSFPLLDASRGAMDGSNSFMINDQIRSARRIAEDEEVALSYTWLDADVGAEDAEVRVLASWRLLLRIP